MSKKDWNAFLSHYIQDIERALERNVALKVGLEDSTVQTIDGELIIAKKRPGDRIPDMCENCVERGRIIGPSCECLRYGGIAGKTRVCDSHEKRIYVVKCPTCGKDAYFTELVNNYDQLIGVGFYICGSCGWSSSKNPLDLIKPRGLTNG